MPDVTLLLGVARLLDDHRAKAGNAVFWGSGLCTLPRYISQIVTVWRGHALSGLGLTVWLRLDCPELDCQAWAWLDWPVLGLG